jgi:hypothetical protein
MVQSFLLDMGVQDPFARGGFFANQRPTGEVTSDQHF